MMNNSEYLNNLCASVLCAIGSEQGRMLPSGWVMEAKSCTGRDIMIFINERTAQGWKEPVYSFSEDWMDFVKDHAGSAFIAVVEEGKPEHINIIDPENPHECGFNLSHSVDESGIIYYHYSKLRGTK